MRKRCASLIFLILFFSGLAYAADPGIDVEIYKISDGNAPSYEGELSIGVGMEGVKTVALKHPSLASPVILMQNTGGFDGIELDRAENWSQFVSLLPNGNYEVIVKQGLQTIRHPFTINYALMPATPVITYPAHEEVLPTPELTITWQSAPAGVDRINVEVEIGPDSWGMGVSDELDPTATSYTIPSGLLIPGKNYELSVKFTRFEDGYSYDSVRSLAFSVAP